MQQDRLLTRSRAASAIIACSLLVTRVTSSRVRVCVLIERDENSCKSTRTFKKQGKKTRKEKKISSWTRVAGDDLFKIAIYCSQ